MPDWFGAQIDHVFVTSPIAAEDFAVRELAGSDHRAVIAEVALPEGG
jgi:endonuclease/exonuclease/phosphatase (EEP) superfamily protein YafD